MEQAITLRCTFADVDVQRTADDELIPLHDEQLNPTTNGPGLVSEIALENLRKPDAGGGQIPPTLERVLQAASGRIGLILELKLGVICLRCMWTVRPSGFNRSVIYGSFFHKELPRIRRTDPDVETLVLFKRLPKDPSIAARRLHANHVDLRVDTVSQSRVTALR